MKNSSIFCIGTLAVVGLGNLLYTDSSDLEKRVKKLEETVASLKKENRSFEKELKTVKEIAVKNSGTVSGLTRDVRNVTQDQKRTERQADSALRMARRNQSDILTLKRRR